MSIIFPLTRGAHDGGFIGMMTGLLIGQMLFSLWLLEYKWYFSIPIGLLIATVAILLSYATNAFFGYSSDAVLQLMFFITYISTSILFFELAHRLRT